MSKQSRKLIIKKAKARKSGSQARIIEKINLKTNKKNQFVAFFKPETFLDKAPEQIEKILNMVFDKFEEYGVDITGSAHFPGPALGEFSIMDRHYGVINRLSKSASKVLSSEEKELVLKTLGIKDGKRKILGGHEAYPNSGMNVFEFDKYWLTSPSTKIRSGFYVREMQIASEKIVVVNGFHPNQLEHYTGAGRELIIMIGATNTSWQTFRQDMLGETFPDKAKPESIRGTLYKNPKEYGFEKVGIDNNVLHISAGPTEALFEMDNFLNNAFGIDILTNGANLSSKLITEGFGPNEIKELITMKEIHDELEHKDTSYAVKFLKKRKKLNK